MKTLKLAIKEAGGVQIVASRLGVSPQRLSNWATRKTGVPLERAAELESVFCSLDVKFNRQDMFPYDWHRIWPELNE